MRSQSEEDGIAMLAATDKRVLSVGISTGGEAELRMIALQKDRTVVATTLDDAGAVLVRDKVQQSGLTNKIEVRLEDISDDALDYEPASFDFVYARLVLHYLAAQKLEVALKNIHSLLRSGGRLFVVVRSEDCEEAKQDDNYFDPNTKLTTYTVASGGRRATRYFHTQQSITEALERAGFDIVRISQFDEALSPSFARDDAIWVPNNVIELLAQKKTGNVLQ